MKGISAEMGESGDAMPPEAVHIPKPAARAWKISRLLPHAPPQKGTYEINVWSGRNSADARHLGHLGEDPTQVDRVDGGSCKRSGWRHA